MVKTALGQVGGLLGQLVAQAADILAAAGLKLLRSSEEYSKYQDTKKNIFLHDALQFIDSNHVTAVLSITGRLTGKSKRDKIIFFPAAV